MPIWEPSLQLAGLTPADVTSHSTTSCRRALDANFLLHLGPFGDVIPIPLPIIQNVGVDRRCLPDLRPRVLPVRRRRSRPAGARRGAARGDPGAPGRDRDARWPPRRGRAGRRDRPLARTRPAPSPSNARSSWAAPGPGLASPSLSRPSSSSAARRPAPIAITDPATVAETVERVRQHPYVRLALNGSFSALWAGQLISLFGDRLNQLALVAVVAISTGSALATGPRLLRGDAPEPAAQPDRRHVRRPLGPQGGHGRQRHPAGGDRAGHPDRGGDQHRPRLPADLPRRRASRSSSGRRGSRSCRRSCPSEDLLSANSALWVGETHRRRHRLPAGRPLRGRSSASAVPLAFWVDSATYLASAALLATIVVQARARRSADERRRHGRGLPRRADGGLAVPAPRDGPARQHAPGRRRPVQPRHRDRADAELRQADLQRQPGSAGRRRTASSRPGSGSATWSAGSSIGLIGARFAKGRMVIAGYAAWGLLIFLFALSTTCRSRSGSPSARASPTWSSSSRARRSSRNGRRRS